MTQVDRVLADPEVRLAKIRLTNAIGGYTPGVPEVQEAERALVSAILSVEPGESVLDFEKAAKAASAAVAVSSATRVEVGTTRITVRGTIERIGAGDTVTYHRAVEAK